MLAKSIALRSSNQTPINSAHWNVQHESRGQQKFAWELVIKKKYQWASRPKTISLAKQRLLTARPRYCAAQHGINFSRKPFHAVLPLPVVGQHATRCFSLCSHTRLSVHLYIGKHYVRRQLEWKQTTSPRHNGLAHWLIPTTRGKREREREKVKVVYSRLEFTPRDSCASYVIRCHVTSSRAFETIKSNIAQRIVAVWFCALLANVLAINIVGLSTEKYVYGDVTELG